MYNNIENQIVRQALKLPDLKTNQAKKLESILDQAYRALQNKQPEMARRILQSGGALEEAESQTDKDKQQATKLKELQDAKTQEESKPNPNKAKLKTLEAQLRNQERLIVEAQKTNLVAKPSVTIKSTVATQPEVSTQPEVTKKPEDKQDKREKQEKAQSDETPPAKPIDEFAWVVELQEPEAVNLPKSKSIAGPTKSIEYIKRNFKNCLKDGLVPIPADNHCMFTAFGYGLMRTLGQTHDQALAWANENKMKLRELASYYVCNPAFGRKNQNDRLRSDKITTLDSDGPCPEDKNIKDIKSYCTLFKGSKCWGDEIELSALLQFFKKNALLYQRPKDIKDAPVRLIGINDEVFNDKTEINPRELIYLT